MVIIFLAFIAGMPSVFFLTLAYWKGGHRIIKYFLFMQYLFLAFAFARFAFADVIITYSQLWQSNIAAFINVFVFVWGALLTYTFSGAYLQLAGFRFRGIQRLFFVFISLLTAISAIQPILSATQDKLVIAQESVINGFLIPFIGLQYLVMIGILAVARKKKPESAEKSTMNWLLVQALSFGLIALVLVFSRISMKIKTAYTIELVATFILTWNIACSAYFALRIRKWIGLSRSSTGIPTARVEKKSTMTIPSEEALQRPKIKYPKEQSKSSLLEASLETAKAMLEDQENTLSLFKIAQLSGFKNKEAMDLALRKTEGLTAVEFRMKQRKNC